MAAYAPVPAFAERKRHPRALLLIVAGHAALLGAVITAKMDLPERLDPTKTSVTFVPLPEDPPPLPPEPARQSESQPSQSQVFRPEPLVQVPSNRSSIVDTVPVPLPDPGPIIGPSRQPQPRIEPVPVPNPVRTGPRFITPAEDVRPPYPDQKRARDEEAALRLQLSIDARGRVVAVEPVGPADRVFLNAARRHILARWRYKPAMDGDHPIPSSTVVTLRFELASKAGGWPDERLSSRRCPGFRVPRAPAPHSPTCALSCASGSGSM